MWFDACDRQGCRQANCRFAIIQRSDQRRNCRARIRRRFAEGSSGGSAYLRIGITELGNKLVRGATAAESKKTWPDKINAGRGLIGIAVRFLAGPRGECHVNLGVDVVTDELNRPVAKQVECPA